VKTGQLRRRHRHHGAKPDWHRPCDGGFSDPPTQQESRDYRDCLETLRAALVR